MAPDGVPDWYMVLDAGSAELDTARPIATEIVLMNLGLDQTKLPRTMILLFQHRGKVEQWKSDKP
jgi:hypothetical protein